MPSISVLDGGGATQTIQTLPAVGAAAAAASLPVTTATDDPVQTKLGIVTETAPASDTASSGLNGRLQRVAQRLTSLIGLLPTALGSAASAASLPVVIASDQASLPITPAVSTTASVLLSSAATTNATSVKGSAGSVKAIQGYNAKTLPVYLKLYDKASAPTVGTDTPVKTLYLPPSAAFALDFGFKFATGIAYALTGAAALADTTALASGDILCLNVDYI